jgi:ribose-phosphate pyrophosphokinase
VPHLRPACVAVRGKRHGPRHLLHNPKTDVVPCTFVLRTDIAQAHNQNLHGCESTGCTITTRNPLVMRELMPTFAPLKIPCPVNDMVKILAGSASRYLGEQVAREFGVDLGNVIIQRFSDGEFQPSIEETVRGKDVIIVQSTFPPTDNLMELLLLIDAAKRASAKRIVAVMPYFGFARQDRKDKPRVAIGAKLVANLLTAAGVHRVITMDLHAEQIQGFFEVPVDHLYASTLFVPMLEQMNIPDLVIAAPDTGGTKRANAYAKILGVDLAICYKQRKVANKVESMTVIGDVAGKNVVLIDDMIDTAGTLCKAADMMIENGAKSVRAICTHPVLSGPAYERIAESKILELIVSDSIPLRTDKDTTKIRVTGTAKLFADVLHNLIENKSISSHFIIS